MNTRSPRASPGVPILLWLRRLRLLFARWTQPIRTRATAAWRMGRQTLPVRKIVDWWTRIWSRHPTASGR